MRKSFLNPKQKFQLIIPYCKVRNQEFVKEPKDFAQLLRQWPCLLKVKTHLISYRSIDRFRQYRSYTDFYIKLDLIYTDNGLHFW